MTHQLSEQHISVVKSTIPLLETAGDSITQHFYERLFSHNPELQHIFNMSNQHSGRQQVALFNAVAAYAKNIDNLAVLSSAVERIANKHTSFNIQPEHYPIVGHHLIETLRELAGDVFTPAIEEAWVAAYDFLAKLFIQQESGLYKEHKEKVGGWTGARKFRLLEKKIESELVKSLIFEPIDKQAVADYQPGQYIGIRVNVPGHEYLEIRQYSLSDKPREDTYRISVKREIMGMPGVVSNFLHDGLRLGDEVELYSPAGDFFYQERQAPVVLISAGVGATPMQAILETLADKALTGKPHQEPVYYLHACDNLEQHSFKKRVQQLSSSLPLKHYTWYRADHAEEENIFRGFMDLAALENDLPLLDGHFYLCGPVAFMQFAKQQLVTLGVDVSHIHYEVFGPHEDF